MSQIPSRSTLLRLLREAIAWDHDLERDEPPADRVEPEWRREAEEILANEEEAG